ncbi:hypothetical protein JOB18_036994 [Solea senegalensis]|uniref:Uncharacterized protein n=1 Tax=Solea senegalensis TaxID=28829 RepID=A0AAV6QDS9_SOLSE|nr:hypothetical protein JOB18_036994 [Solea senegalensis]
MFAQWYRTWRHEGGRISCCFPEVEKQLHYHTPHLPDMIPSGPALPQPDSWGPNCVYTMVSTSVYILPKQTLCRVRRRAVMKADVCCKTDRGGEREQDPS